MDYEGKKYLWLTDSLAHKSKEIPPIMEIKILNSLCDSIFKIAWVILGFTASMPALCDVHFQWRNWKRKTFNNSSAISVGTSL